MNLTKLRSFWCVAAHDLWRHRPRTIAILVPLLLVMGLAASVTLLRDGLTRDATRSAGALPDITVQRMIGGRVERVPCALIDSLLALPHVVEAIPRVWGYVPVQVAQGEVVYTLMGVDLERMPIPDDIGLSVDEGRFLSPEGREAVVGKAFASVYGAEVGDRLTLEDALGNSVELEIVGFFGNAVEIYAADLLVVSITTAREFFGYGEKDASDICVYLDDPANSSLTALEMIGIGDNLRLMTREALAEINEQAYGRRGGVFQLVWLILLLTVCLVAWAQGASIGLALRREVGVLKAIGWSTLDIIEIRLLESVILGVIGTLGGILLGFGYLVLDAPGIKQYFLGWATVYPDFPVPVHLRGASLFQLFVVGVFPLIVATVVPAWRVGIIEPDEAIRSD
jgi:ABC-type lipoprotein release transport system permease subunit